MRVNFMVCFGAFILPLAVAAGGRAGAPTLTLDLPLPRQVAQRNAQEWADVKLAGNVPAGATVVEARAALGPTLHRAVRPGSVAGAVVEARAAMGAALRGKAVDWTVVAQGGQIKDGRFSGSLKLETGGWYALSVRCRKSADDAAIVAESDAVPVGVGDIFITAGQSNSVNYGYPRQRSEENLSVYFDGKRFTPAADPIPDACGDGGTPWPILGDMLSRTTRAPVCFRSATVNWLRVREWVPGAHSGNIERLVERAKWFGPSGFRAVLWVQGEADAGRPDFTPAQQYEREAKSMIEFSRRQLGWPVDWFVAANCYCPPNGKADWKEGMACVLKAQKALWDQGIACRGPDTNDLTGNREYRHDGIHFGPRGLRIHAERWFAVLSTHYSWVNPVTSTLK